MDSQQLILVNEQDEELGVMEKMEAHRKGVLHRAFSIFVFDADGNMLLQQRAAGKYHGGHLWTNACCSHPHPNESTENAAKRRLFEEMGFATSLEKIFSFIYRAEVENDLIEHEFDHVFAGIYEGEINANPEEVAAYKFEEMSVISKAIKNDPAKFTAWFRIAFPKIESWWKEKWRVAKMDRQL